MLEPAELMAQARERAQCTNFGGEDFVEPLQRYTDSVNRESNFSEIGAATVREMLIRALTNRLQIEDWYARHPEIDAEEIVDPVFITGQPRTGSTALGHMLAVDPQTRSLRTWEAAQPCPPPELANATTDPRIAEANRKAKVFEALVPSVREALPRDSNGPDECYPLLHLSMANIAMDAWSDMPSFDHWLLESGFDWDPVYRYHKRVIKLLQWRHPAKRWVLRAPTHVFGIESLAAAYPNARFVMTHRDPVKTMPSVASLMFNMLDVMLADADPVKLGTAMVDKWALGTKRLMAFRERIGDDRFFDNSHSRQIRDAEGQIADLYAWLGWDFDDAMRQRIRNWSTENPKGKHRPKAEFFGMNEDQIRQKFAGYIERFNPCF